MSVNVLYRTSARPLAAGPAGPPHLDWALDVGLTKPKELGGPGGEGNNCEQLLLPAMPLASSAQFVASQGGAKVPTDATVTATVGIGPRSEGGFGLTVALEVSLPGLGRSEAEALVAKTHEGICPYSNAIRNNVEVDLHIV